jgi:hypothetical protein
MSVSSELYPLFFEETFDTTLHPLSDQQEYGDNHHYGNKVNKEGMLAEELPDIGSQQMLREKEIAVNSLMNDACSNGAEKR